jgi:hypothetical protein
LEFILGGVKKIVIDIVCNAGNSWVCIVARNAKQLRWKGEAFGNRTGIKERVEELIFAGSTQPNKPSILLCLPSKTSFEIQDKLKEKFSALQLPPSESPQADSEYFKPYKPIFFAITPNPSTTQEMNISHITNSEFKYANLDTSSLIALSSDITNGFAEVFLKKQR